VTLEGAGAKKGKDHLNKKSGATFAKKPEQEKAKVPIRNLLESESETGIERWGTLPKSKSKKGRKLK